MVILESVEPGEVKIRGVETALYLSMTGSGTLVGIEDGSDGSAVFVERVLGPYIAYMSRHWAHHGWHVGIKKSGKVKNGKKTLYPWAQHAIKFLHRAAFPSPHPIKVLENLHGWRLAVFEDGSVRGVREGEGDGGEARLSDLEISPGPQPGTVRLRGVQSGLYISMDSQGRLGACTEDQTSALYTIFVEEVSLTSDTVTYLSLRSVSPGHTFSVNNSHVMFSWAHKGWHIGIKKSGKPKNGKKTIFPQKQKAIQFRFCPSSYSGKQAPSTIDLSVYKDVMPSLKFIDEE